MDMLWHYRLCSLEVGESGSQFCKRYGYWLIVIGSSLCWYRILADIGNLGSVLRAIAQEERSTLIYCSECAQNVHKVVEPHVLLCRQSDLVILPVFCLDCVIAVFNTYGSKGKLRRVKSRTFRSWILGLNVLGPKQDNIA